MKNRKHIFALALVAVLFGATACHQYDAVSVDDLYVAEADAWQKTHTIAQFLDAYMTDLGTVDATTGKLKYPPRARSYQSANPTKTNLGLFSVDDIPNSQPVVIVGRIVSSDVAGNIYKTLYIQDIDHPEQGLKLSVDNCSSPSYLLYRSKNCNQLRRFSSR